jgi:hypothetical protein
MAMTPGSPFKKIGITSAIAAATTAPTAVQLVGDNANSSYAVRSYRLCNPGNSTAYFAYGANASDANTQAVIPTNATVGGGSIPVLSNTVSIVSAEVGQYWTCITPSANFTVFITPGIGIS